ncbi:MAG TPA: sigma-54 dependent transcriptional regulator [Pyrinomonadaceae bacterium]|nr:sigma-54 dependent transcriptional regulator [Pyrinomonadaceae bacterium]
MNRKIRVLVVDDDNLLRKLVTEQLAKGDFDAAPATSGQQALDILREADYDVVLLDIMMPGLSGLDTLREIRRLEDPPEVIMLTADTSLSTGIEAMRHGAYDYLTKPATLDEMEAIIRKADEKRRLVKQNASLRSVARGVDEVLPIVKANPLMATLVAQAENAARTDSTILITGESGTGKDVLARLIHSKSARHSTPIITVNCGALPETLFESEFFGHERGAFTGASALRRGLIEAADGSTLFLDEIGDLPLQMQVKLLHFLEQGRFRRVGSTRDQSADVRIIAATNRNLADEVERKHFRADLYYRLNVVALHVPPLRKRTEDTPELIEYFLGVYRQRFNRPGLNLSAAARQRMQDYAWPGNVRELRNYLERAAALSLSDTIEADQLLGSGVGVQGAVEKNHPPSPFSQHASPTLEELEREHILRVLNESEGNRERAAAILGISSRTLYRKLREYETHTRSAGLATES